MSAIGKKEMLKTSGYTSNRISPSRVVRTVADLVSKNR